MYEITNLTSNAFLRILKVFDVLNSPDIIELTTFNKQFSTNSNFEQIMKRKLFLVTVALFFLNALTFAQQTTVKGTVTSNDGLSLPGATIIIQGTSIGTVTDIDGNYLISVEGMVDPVLIFSFIGYLNEQVPVNNQATIDMVLIQLEHYLIYLHVLLYHILFHHILYLGILFSLQFLN